MIRTLDFSVMSQPRLRGFHCCLLLFQTNSGDTSGVVECCFCGMSFDSPVSLSVHQMSVPTVSNSCRKCRKFFQSDEDYDHHICSKVLQSFNSSHYSTELNFMDGASFADWSVFPIISNSYCKSYSLLNM